MWGPLLRFILHANTCQGRWIKICDQARKMLPLWVNLYATSCETKSKKPWLCLSLPPPSHFQTFARCGCPAILANPLSHLSSDYCPLLYDLYASISPLPLPFIRPNEVFYLYISIFIHIFFLQVGSTIQVNWRRWPAFNVHFNYFHV